MRIAARDVEYTWRSRNSSVKAVTKVSAEFPSGVPHFLCGPSGSGKTTLGQLLAGLIVPDHGTILLGGEPPRLTESAFVFQFPETVFFEDTIGGELREMQIAVERARAVFAGLGMDYDELAAQNPFRLSAGYGRLVALGLQLARAPRVLVLDEPSIGLDWRFHGRVARVLREWIQPERILLVISHDLDLMREIGGRAWIMNSGTLVWNGAVADLLADGALLGRFALRA